MPDLSLTPEQELLRNAARDFVERECPLSTVRHAVEREGGFSRKIWEQIAALGWAGILVPSRYGGEGATLTDAAVLYEELGRGLVPVPAHSSGVLAAQVIERAGGAAQREGLLPAIARGERVVALAFTEPDYGWEPERVHMTAQRRGDTFVLSGTKGFVPDAGAADELVVTARLDGEVRLFVVPVTARGVERRAMAGFSGQPLFEIAFDGVEVPAQDALEGDWDAVEPALDVATALLCAYMAGAARRVYEITMDYAARREQFGQPIARFQRVQDRLVDMLNAADAARWTAYEAVWKLEQGKPGASEAASVAKIAASNGFYLACENAHHVHAGVGSDKAYGLYLYTQASRGLYHHLGDPAHHRRRLARLLGL